MALVDDPVAALLPQSSAARLDRAQRLVRCLQLLVDDACSGDGGRTSLGWESARSELERAAQGDLRAAVEVLLQRAIAALAGPGTWLVLGTLEGDVRRAWRVLDDHAEDHPWLPTPEEAHVEPRPWALRLLEAWKRCGAEESSLVLWRARIEHACGEWRAAESSLRDRLRTRWDMQSWKALVAVLLERGAAREAHQALVEGLQAEPARSQDGELRRLAAWAACAVGDWPQARLLALGLEPQPSASAAWELRERLGEIYTALPARPPEPGQPRYVPPFERAACGACALLVYAHGPQGVHLVRSEVSAGLRERVTTHARERDESLSVPTSREARLLASVAVQIDHRRDGAGPLEGVLGTHSVCVALAPIVDGEGEPMGWLHAEFEHHLAPAQHTLRAWAQTLAVSLRSAQQAPVGANRESARACEPSAQTQWPHTRAEFAFVVEQLGMKVNQRLWRGYLPEGGQALEVAHGGLLSLLQAPAGQARAVTRAMSLRTCVGWDEPDERLACSREARSGQVLPFELEGRTAALLVYESVRSRDFAAFRAAPALQYAAERAPALRLAAFQDVHAQEDGWAPVWDTSRRDVLEFARRVVIAARARTTVVVSGERGVGKTMIARWMHYESGREALHVLDAQQLKELPQAARSAVPTTMVLDGLECLSSELQESLLRVLEEQDSAAARTPMRWVVCCTGRLQELLSSTRVRPDLLARLMRYELHVPPVRQRRSDIPSMMTALIGRTAAAEGLRAPRLAEDACALLWRQSYPGNLRDLESLACTLVLHLRREEIHAPELQQCATAFGMPLAERVQSRHPNREVVLDALWATRTGSGRTNKTRAAEWLGWDPDTMVAKMKALKIPDEVPCQTAWEQAPWEATPQD